MKWIRSGIAFTRRQKEIVRSLGLRRLHQVVERPDTPQIRGLIESVPHMVTVVEKPVQPAWLAVPEYTIFPPEPGAEAAPRKKRAEKPKEAVAAAGEAESQGEKKHAAAKAEKPAAKHVEKKAAKAASAKAKSAKASEGRKAKSAAKEKESKAHKKGKK